MSKSSETLDWPTASNIYDVLVRVCRASKDGREGFVYAQGERHVSEWRFMGALGFGGKFWRTTGRRPDGSWGEVWCVNQYSENETPESRIMIDAANAELWKLLREYEAHSGA